MTPLCFFAADETRDDESGTGLMSVEHKDSTETSDDSLLQRVVEQLMQSQGTKPNETLELDSNVPAGPSQPSRSSQVRSGKARGPCTDLRSA